MHFIHTGSFLHPECALQQFFKKTKLTTVKRLLCNILSASMSALFLQIHPRIDEWLSPERAIFWVGASSGAFPWASFFFILVMQENTFLARFFIDSGISQTAFSCQMIWKMPIRTFRTPWKYWWLEKSFAAKTSPHRHPVWSMSSWWKFPWTSGLRSETIRSPKIHLQPVIRKFRLNFTTRLSGTLLYPSLHAHTAGCQFGQPSQSGSCSGST